MRLCLSTRIRVMPRLARRAFPHAAPARLALVAALVLAAAAVARADAPVGVMHVKVQTSNVTGAGTDDDVFIKLEVFSKGQKQTLEWELDNGAENFERNQEDNFEIAVNGGFKDCEVGAIGIRKSEDDSNGGWRLAWFQIYFDGQLFHTAMIKSWLEDDDRERWAMDFKRQMCAPPPPPSIVIEQVPLPPCKVTVEINTQKEFPDKLIKDDKDCDGTADDSDTDGFNPPDSDKDGLPDALEDPNRNGQVDPGETDPNKPDLDSLPDADDDNLADIFEDVMGTDKNNPDSDGDGWSDGPADVRTYLYLLRVECINPQEDVELGDDEIFIAVNHARWPQAEAMDGSWEMSGGEGGGSLTEIARRTRGKDQAANFSVRVDLREDDWFDFTDDNGGWPGWLNGDGFFLDRDLAFNENQTFSTEHKDEGLFNTVHYRIHFVAVSDWLADPNPKDPEADADRDGLTEKVEFQTGGALAGMADPEQPDIYVELDAVGPEQVPERYSKEDFASLFTYRGYALHLDDGVFGGGQVLPADDSPIGFVDAQKIRNASFDLDKRCGVFRYVLAVNEYDDDLYGQADKPIKDKAGKTLCRSGFFLAFETDYLDHVSDLESILWIHEFGHTLGLCHPPGSYVGIATGPGIDECSACSDGSNGGCQCTRPDGSAAGEDCNCTHYMVNSSSDTAMGRGIKPPYIPDLIIAIDREPMYDEKEWAVVDLTPINRSSCP